MLEVDFVGAFSSFTIDISSTIFLLRVLYEIYTNPEARSLDCCANLPLIFYTGTYSVLSWVAWITFFIIHPNRIANGLGDCDLDDKSIFWNVAKSFMFTLASGYFPAIIISVYLPFLALKKSLVFSRIDHYDILRSFGISLIVTACVGAYMVPMWLYYPYDYEVLCALAPLPTLIALSIGYVLAIPFLCYMWFHGLKAYLQLTWNRESVGTSEVFRFGTSGFLKCGSKETISSETYFEENRLSVSDVAHLVRLSVGNSLSESPSNRRSHGAFVELSEQRRIRAEAVTNRLSPSALRVIAQFNSRFLRVWVTLFLVTFIIYTYLLAAEFYDDLSPWWFLCGWISFKTTNFLSCYLFFQSPSLKGVSICCCCCGGSSDEWDYREFGDRYVSI